MSVNQATPVFSIFSIVKNVQAREAMFRRSIESVLRQTYGDFEFVIQDGGSTDATAEIVAEYRDRRIRFASEPDSCPEEGFFRALKRCRGAFIGSCLSDEELLPDALDNAARAFAVRPDIAAFYGNVGTVNEKGEKGSMRTPAHPFSLEAYARQDVVPPFSASFFRRDALERAGLHGRGWRYGIGEFEFWIRLAGAGRIVYLPLNISYFGRHAQSNTQSAELYDELVATRVRVMDELFRENRHLQDCSVTVEQAIAGNCAWAARSVFRIEGASARCERFMQQAFRYDPQNAQVVKLRSKMRKAALTQTQTTRSVQSPQLMQENRANLSEQGLTIFALPKPFVGDIALIQKNAIRSWSRLVPKPEIFLFGDEPGTQEMAAEVGARHIPQIARNEFGTPLVDKLFQAAQDSASNPLMAYVNADMILFQDFIDGISKVQTRLSEFLLIGQRWDLLVFDEIDFDRPDWQATLQRQMQEEAMIHPESGLDYFVFRRGLWPAIPSFALGRTVWDNWLVSEPSKRGVPVVDGTEYVTAVHQDHDYAHMAGGRQEAWKGTEAERNRALAGPRDESGRTSAAAWALNRTGDLVQVEPHQSYCETVPYKDQRSRWLLDQARRLGPQGKWDLAACKCEEALGLLSNLLRRGQRGRVPVKFLDRDAALHRYVNGYTLLAQCYLKVGRYDQVADAYTRLLENPFVQLPPAARDDVARLRDRAARTAGRQQPSQQKHVIRPCAEPALPKVSVVLACHGAHEFLAECLDSILKQTMPDWELHVLDDGSTDGTRRIIEDYARRDGRIVPYYFDDNAGPYVRRNLAIERAKAPFIVIQDADDLMCPDKLERLHSAIAQDDRLGVVGSFYRMFLDRYQGIDHSEDVTLRTEHEQIIADYRHLAICDYTWHGSAIIRKRLFEEIGPYDSNPFSSDSFWLAKVAEYACRSDAVRLKNIPEFLTLRRMRSDSQTGTLPSYDPRGRRATFRQYRRARLSEMIQELDSDPNIDVKAVLRQSVCDDFLSKHQHLFDSWESQPLTRRMVQQFIDRIYSQFSLDQFVRCITTCSVVDRLVAGIAPAVRGYDLVRALAYFALGVPEKSRVYLERERRAHRTKLAQEFATIALDRYDSRWTRTDRTAMVRKALFGNGPDETNVDPVCVVDRRDGTAELSIVLDGASDPSLRGRQIAALRAQTDKRFEVIALCHGHDAGPLASQMEAGGFSFAVLDAAEHVSCLRHRNEAAVHARGRYVAFLSERVVPEPDFVQNVVRRFEQDEINGLRGRIVSESSSTPLGFDLGPEPLYAACDVDEMCVFRRDVFAGLGGFPPAPFERGAVQLSYRVYTDPQTPTRPILYCPEVVVRYAGPCQAHVDIIDPSAMENLFCTDFLKQAGHLQDDDPFHAVAFFGLVSDLRWRSRPAGEDRYDQHLDDTMFFGKRFPQIAIERARAALACRPSSLLIQYVTGSLYVKLEQPEQACNLFEGLLMPLEALVALGRVDRARSEFAEYGALCECYQASCTLLAQCYMKRGQQHKVPTVYRRLLTNQNLRIPAARRQEMERLCERLSDSPAKPTQVAPAPVPERVEVNGDAVAELEGRYRAMPPAAPAKHATALRLAELCRRVGQAAKGNAYALQALKIKNAGAFDSAKRQKPNVCTHKPTIVEFNVIGRCNAGCIMCNYGSQGEDFDLDKFERVADELLPAAQRVLLIGGEVLLHPDFYEMCEYVHRFGLCLEMTTNLSTLAGNRADAIRRFFGSVRVSIDAATRQTYESIRTQLSFDRLQKNLQVLADIKQQRPEFQLQLAFAAMRQNIEELPDTLEMVSRFGFNSAAVSFVHVNARLTLDDSLLFHRERANHYFDLARRQAAALGMRLDIPNNFDLAQRPFLAPDKLTDGHKQCVRPWQRVRVLLNGDVIPCCHLYSLPMGNAFADPFEQTWNGVKYRDFRQAMVASSPSLPAACKHCELISGPTDSNDALLHINPNRLAELKQCLEADPSPRTDVVCRPSDSIRPKVTVITACHNAERFLAECLETICSQSLQEWELLLLDDASTDGTRAVMAEYAQRDPRIRPFYFETNAGPYARRNAAIAQARSEYIVIHDADDLMAPTKLETLCREISSDPDLAMVGSCYRTFFEQFKSIRHTDPIDLPLDHETIAEYAATWRHAISHGTAIIRKSMFERIGGYDANPFSSDAFWSAKLAEFSRHDPHARFRNVSEYLTLYRVHSVSQTQVLSVFDPRNRRVRFRAYCESKLQQIREKMRSVPGADLAQELRDCKCSDFLTRFKAQIIKWESEPLDPRVPTNLLAKAVEAFNGDCYVSCLSVLNGAEGMEPALSRRIVGLNLLRGMALYALDMAEESRASLEREIDRHDNPAARKLIGDAFAGDAALDVSAWCLENGARYDLGLSLAQPSGSGRQMLAAGGVQGRGE